MLGILIVSVVVPLSDTTLGVNDFASVGRPVINDATLVLAPLLVTP